MFRSQDVNFESRPIFFGQAYPTKNMFEWFVHPDVIIGSLGQFPNTRSSGLLGPYRPLIAHAGPYTHIEKVVLISSSVFCSLGRTRHHQVRMTIFRADSFPADCKPPTAFQI